MMKLLFYDFNSYSFWSMINSQQIIHLIPMFNLQIPAMLYSIQMQLSKLALLYLENPLNLTYLFGVDINTQDIDYI